MGYDAGIDSWFVRPRRNLEGRQHQPAGQRSPHLSHPGKRQPVPSMHSSACTGSRQQATKVWHKNQGLMLVGEVDHHEIVKNTDAGHQLFGLRQPFRTPFRRQKIMWGWECLRGQRFLRAIKSQQSLQRFIDPRDTVRSNGQFPCSDTQVPRLSRKPPLSLSLMLRRNHAVGSTARCTLILR